MEMLKAWGIPGKVPEEEQSSGNLTPGIQSLRGWILGTKLDP